MNTHVHQFNNAAVNCASGRNKRLPAGQCRVDGGEATFDGRPASRRSRRIGDHK